MWYQEAQSDLLLVLQVFWRRSLLLRTLYKHCFLLYPVGRIRTKRQSSGSATNVASIPDNRGRSRAKVVSQSQRKKYILCSLLSSSYSTIHFIVEKFIVFHWLKGKDSFLWLCDTVNNFHVCWVSLQNGDGKFTFSPFQAI